MCRTDWLAAGWVRVQEKRGEETRGWDSGSPDGTTDAKYEAREREIASKSMPDGVTERRMDSRDAVWTYPAAKSGDITAISPSSARNVGFHPSSTCGIQCPSLDGRTT